MSKHAKLPWWLKSVNRVVIALNRLGLAVGTQRMLSIPSRKTGKLRSTPVSLLTVNGQRYIVTGLETDWVKNARVAGWRVLNRGRKQERVALAELSIQERPPHPTRIPAPSATRRPVLRALARLTERSRGVREGSTTVPGVPCRECIGTQSPLAAASNGGSSFSAMKSEAKKSLLMSNTATLAVAMACLISSRQSAPAAILVSSQ